MKIKKMLIYIIIIFLIIQLVEIFFINRKSYATTYYGEGFFEGVFKTGKNYSDIGEANNDKITNSTTDIEDTLSDIYSAIRTIGLVIILAMLIFSIIALSSNIVALDKAKVKTTLLINVGLAILFIFAEPIIEFFKNLFEQLQSTM